LKREARSLPQDNAEMGIVFAPDHFDRKVQRRHQRQTLAVSLQLIVKLRRHLNEGRTGTRLSQEILAHQRADKFVVFAHLL
jgi:hypothetical protein